MTALVDDLEAIVAEAGHSELYGLEVLEETPARERVLAKFLTANKGDEALARAQLVKTLKWRKEFGALATLTETHKPEFERIGVVTRAPSGRAVTWNLYGAVSNRKELFGDLEGFTRWRISLMERGIRAMDLSSTEYDQMDQVHDYMDVSFLRLDGETRKASSTIIQMFQEYYPEFLRAKYFVNVPYLVSWMMAFMRNFMSKETVDKFHVLANGSDLVYDLGDWVPNKYGGKGEALSALAVSGPESGAAAGAATEPAAAAGAPSA